MSRKEYFNNAASTWDLKYYTRELAEFLEIFVPKFGIDAGEYVLDVGTGTGILIPYLLKAIGPYGSITAVDYAEKMIEECISKYGDIENVKILLQDVENLKLPSEYFDTVVCFGLFPHIVNKEKALNQFSRVLKNKGKLVIAHALSSNEIRMHHDGVSDAVSMDFLPEKKEMKTMLNQEGFTNVFILDIPGRYLCTSNKL